MEIKKDTFGELDGKKVESYTLMNNQGMSFTCINYGCIITELVVPNKNGKLENVVLGFDNLTDYIEHSPFFGAVVGRVAGRMKGASFELDGKTYQVLANEKGNHLHGGAIGFDKVFWEATIKENEEEIAVEFSYKSKDGEEGYPGNLEMKVTYTLNNQNELIISYFGETDKKTLVNLTNHTYFNLSGNFENDILHHQLTMDSEKYVELDDVSIPTGNLLNVDETVFDFRNGRTFSEGIRSEDPQIVKVGNGYDHPFVLNEKNIELVDKSSGRKLVIETDQPAVILYTGNQLKGDFNVRGVPVKKYQGLCLETQGLPDSIHHDNFGTCVLDKGQIYKAKTIYRFEIEKIND